MRRLSAMSAVPALVLALLLTAGARQRAGSGQEPPAPQQPSVAHGEEQSPAARLARKIESAVRDPDARVREAQRRELLSLAISELPVLREAVALLSRSEISPLARVLVREMVVHIHIREAKERFVGSLEEEARTHAPFLGIRMGGDQFGSSPGQKHGVFIVSTEPGFVAYEMFEEGDLLIAVRTEAGEAPLKHFPDLAAAFARLMPGDHVEFLVVRGGAVMRVPLRLDERIDQPEQTFRWEQAKTEALHAAERYWQEQIVPLLPRQGGAVARGE